MKKFILSAATVAVMLSLSLPAAAQNKSLWGTIIGGAGGGYLGSMIGNGTGRLAATAGGTLLGAVMGRSVGTSLDRADALYNSPAGYSNRSYQQRPHWGPNNISHPYPHRPRYVARRVVRTRHNGCASGYTREYQTVVTIGGREVPAWGRACYMRDGSWQKVGGLNY